MQDICELRVEWLDDINVRLWHPTGISSGIMDRLDAFARATDFYRDQHLLAGSDWHDAEAMARTMAFEDFLI